MSSLTDAQDLPFVRLPEPWKTKYELWQASSGPNGRIFQLRLAASQSKDSVQIPQPLHHDTLYFSELITSPQASSVGPDDNTDWGRACRNLVSFVTWDGESAPTVGQIWTLVYALVSLRPTEEAFRLSFSGAQKDQLLKELSATGLGIPFPNAPGSNDSSKINEDITITRAAFWQGAGSPFGPRPAWVAQPELSKDLRQPATDYPSYPLQYTVTTDRGNRPVNAQHPLRPAKPAPGSTIYSRYIPHLDEFFSMVHLDYRDPTHLGLFNKWQNDPRVAVNWKETGTLDEHREYLRKIDEDPHQIAVLAKFDDNYFAYFEVYWAKVNFSAFQPEPQPHTMLTI